MKILNTAVDSDVGYNGAEFKSVCSKYSQSLEKKNIQYGSVSIINEHSAQVKCDFSNVEPKSTSRLFQSQIRQSRI